MKHNKTILLFKSGVLLPYEIGPIIQKNLFISIYFIKYNAYRLTDSLKYDTQKVLYIKCIIT